MLLTLEESEEDPGGEILGEGAEDEVREGGLQFNELWEEIQNLVVSQHSPLLLLVLSGGSRGWTQKRGVLCWMQGRLARERVGVEGVKAGNHQCGEAEATRDDQEDIRVQIRNVQLVEVLELLL